MHALLSRETNSAVGSAWLASLALQAMARVAARALLLIVLGAAETSSGRACGAHTNVDATHVAHFVIANVAVSTLDLIVPWAICAFRSCTIRAPATVGDANIALPMVAKSAAGAFRGVACRARGASRRTPVGARADSFRGGGGGRC